MQTRDELRPLLVERLRTRSVGEWLDTLRAAGVPCGAVRDLAAVLHDSQLIERAMVVALDHPVAGAIRALGVPVKLGDTPGSVRTAPPTLGQHTEQVLANDVGLSEEEISRLKTAGAV